MPLYGVQQMGVYNDSDEDESNASSEQEEADDDEAQEDSLQEASDEEPEEPITPLKAKPSRKDSTTKMVKKEPIDVDDSLSFNPEDDHSEENDNYLDSSDLMHFDSDEHPDPLEQDNSSVQSDDDQQNEGDHLMNDLSDQSDDLDPYPSDLPDSVQFSYTTSKEVQPHIRKQTIPTNKQKQLN
jgi:hypothetical protein